MSGPPPRPAARGPPRRGGPPSRGPPGRHGPPSRGGPPSRPGPPRGNSRGGPPPTTMASSGPPSSSRSSIGPSSGGVGPPRRSFGQTKPPPTSGSPPGGPPPPHPPAAPATENPPPSQPAVPTPSATTSQSPPDPSSPPSLAQLQAGAPPATTERKQPEPIVRHDLSVEEASREFLENERRYVEEGLRTVYEVFLNRLNVHVELNRPVLDEGQIHKIFGSLVTLYTVNQKLYSDLMNLRLQGEDVLQENLGVVMRDFIPHFRMYTDYITKSADGIQLSEELKKHKKWREFLEINERIAQQTLKSLLQQPCIRLAQYLKDLAGLYTSHQREGTAETPAAVAIFEAINEIQNVTEDITQKVRDKKQRRLLGTLQKKVFNDKIQLIASHRYVVKQGELKMIRKANVQKFHFILCNDIMVIGSVPTRWAAGSLIAVFPLIGLRCVTQPNSDSEIEAEYPYRFAVIPQNKNFSPDDSAAGGSVVALAPNQKSMNGWVRTIENTVDDEEHNLRPCNPVELEKRLRRERTSPEGQPDTIVIRDPDRIAEIEAWKAAGKPRRERQSSAVASHNAHAAAAALAGPSPSARGPPRPNAGPTERVAPTTKSPSPQPAAPTGGPPRPPSAGASQPSGPPPAVPASNPAPKRNSRAALLAGIRGGATLKKVTKSPPGNAPASPAPAGDMNALLRGTLNKYRQFVVEDDDDESDDDDWE